MLVPLDGDPDHEGGLPPAAGLAQVCAAALHLIMVVVPTLPTEQAAAAKLLPSAAATLLDLTQQEAAAYLDGWVTELQVDAPEVSAEVSRGDPVTVIVQTARRIRADLIVLGTHGKKGTDAFWSGSITPKISARSRRPLLLVPVHDPA